MKSLYKYKSDSCNSIENLISNKLWVSNVYEMNDPMDFGIYIDKTKIDVNLHGGEELLFHEHFSKGIYCISFSLGFDNKRLWDYYTNGFRGYVAVYDDNSIKNSIKEAKLEYLDGKVDYSNQKHDYTYMFDKFLKGKIDELAYIPSFFTKTEDWKEEQEYRFVLSTPEHFEGRKGFELSVIPSEVIIGYKMSKENRTKIYIWSIENNINVKEYKPNFFSKDITYETLNVNVIIELKKILGEKVVGALIK